MGLRPEAIEAVSDVHPASPAGDPELAAAIGSLAPRRIAPAAARRPRRRLLLAAAALLAILAVAGSAIALGGGTSGIPAIDDLLDRTSVPHEPGQPDPSVQPVPGSISAPVHFDLDGRPLVAVGFHSRREGMICSALVSSGRSGSEAPGSRPG